MGRIQIFSEMTCSEYLRVLLLLVLSMQMSSFFTATANKSTGQKMWKAEIDDFIKNNVVFVVALTWCPRSKKTNMILKQYNIRENKIKWLDLDQLVDYKENFEAANRYSTMITEYMKELTGLGDAPWVFIDGKFYGGVKKVMAAHRSLQLGAILEEAGALA